MDNAILTIFSISGIFFFLTITVVLRILEETREFQQFGYYMLQYLKRRKTLGLHADHLFFITAASLLWVQGLSPLAALIPAAIGCLFQIMIYKGFQPKHPLVFTPRVVRLLFTNAVLFIGSITALWCTTLSHPFVVIPFVFMFLLAPVIVVLTNLINRPLELMINAGYYAQAKKRVQDAPFLRIAAITGSFGKTSVKNILGDMLKRDFNTLVPPSSFNTKLGLTKVIRADLLPTTEVFIAEMGAKKKGEIKETVDMLTPDISVITTVVGQHLETFGSVEKIVAEKSWVYRGLRKGGTAIINADDPLLAELPMRDDVRCVRISAKGNPNCAPSVYVEDIAVDANGSSFTLVDARAVSEDKATERPASSATPEDSDGQDTVPTGDADRISTERIHPQPIRTRMRTGLLGAHNIFNILVAATVALELGANISHIVSATETLQPVKNRLSQRMENGITILEDAFNSNPIGAKAALDVLAMIPSNKRVIITPGMIELGKNEKAVHEQFGKQIAAVCDEVVLVTKKQTENIYRGLEKAGFDMKRVIIVKGMREALKNIHKICKAGDTVLIENDLPDAYEEVV